MATILDANKVIAKTVAAAFGGKPDVVRYWDDNRKSFVDILTCANRPQIGVTSYSTIGLSDYPLCKDGAEYKTRVELVGTCANIHSNFANVLATAAFCIINSGWFVYPGAIFPAAIQMYELSTTMRHVLFMPPFLWETNLCTLELPGKTVAWLLAIPISEEEWYFAEMNGSAALEELFEKKQIDVFDLERPSVA